MHRLITFHPLRENVLDYIGAEGLKTPGGELVKIRRAGHIDFVIEINGTEAFRHDDNLQISAFLNQNEVGYIY